MLTVKECRYTGTHIVVDGGIVKPSNDYINPNIIVVQKEIAGSKFPQFLMDLKHRVEKQIEQDVEVLREIFVLTRSCLAVLINAHQDQEVCWGKGTLILLQGFQISQSDLIMEIRHLNFIYHNYEKAKLKIANIASLLACKDVAMKLKSVLHGEVVLTGFNADPAIVLRSYMPSLKEGDCHNFCELCKISVKYIANYDNLGCIPHHGKFRTWVDVKLLKKIREAILSNENYIYDETDKTLQVYGKHLVLIAAFFFQYDIERGMQLKKQKPSPPRELSTISVKF